jgi:hypothetical protein
MCCKEETVNLVMKESVVLRNFIRTREGAENYAVSQSSHHILNDNDDAGRQRLPRAQRLQNQLADYFLTPVVAIPSQWNYIN